MSERDVRRRSVSAVLAAVTAWLAVVAVGSTLVWAVISRAGEGVVSSEGPGSVAGEPVAGLGQPTPPATSARPPSRPSDPRSSSAATTTSAGSPTDGATTPAATPPSSPDPSDDKTHKPDPPSGSQSPQQPTHVDTWNGTGGSVTVECTGSRLVHFSSTPDNGYQTEVEGRGPSSVKLHFEGNDNETEVTGVCSGGEPQFHAQTQHEDRG